ncbi:LexA family transcriptional regulator [Sphingobacterium multivorum]|uniref:LexA family transcriptional regulator n=1 Tax=Sphingobacterium multivorum TaxID=28454 RepID=UPI0028ABD515|nr:LexA family transcriptional regulator [Sphingobacterium multivorum]
MTENQRLKIFREHFGYNQKDFAKRLQMKPGSLSDVERGKVGVSTKLKQILFLACLMNIEWLETGSGEMQHYEDLKEGENKYWVSIYIADHLKDENLHVISERTGNSIESLKYTIQNENAKQLINKKELVRILTTFKEKKADEIRINNSTELIDDSNELHDSLLNQIPMYNFPASAGAVELYGNPNDVKIVGYLNIPGAHKDSFALPAYGHSMYPTIANGDWAVNRPIIDITEIVWGEIYYIEWADYKMYKRLLTGDNEDEVILWSDNQTDMIGNRPKYAPITIKKEKIRKLCIVTEILKKPNY